MGCDITLFLEYKSLTTGHWMSSGGPYPLPRNYDIFALMAGVRSEGRKILYEARGMPSDLSTPVRIAYEKDSGFDITHSPSWLCCGEFGLVIDSYKGDKADILEYEALLAAMSAFEGCGGKARIVFWFMM